MPHESADEGAGKDAPSPSIAPAKPETANKTDHSLHNNKPPGKNNKRESHSHITEESHHAVHETKENTETQPHHSKTQHPAAVHTKHHKRNRHKHKEKEQQEPESRHRLYSDHDEGKSDREIFTELLNKRIARKKEKLLKKAKYHGEGEDLSISRKHSVLTNANSSVAALVRYHEDGMPFVDVNNVVYKPTRKRMKNKHQFLLAWYLSDYIFIAANVIHLILSAFFWSTGITIVSWYTTVDDMLSNFTRITGLDDSNQQSIDSGTVIGALTAGIFFIFQGVFMAINVVLGFNASMFALRILFIAHLVTDAFLILSQCLVAIINIASTSCILRNRFQELFLMYIRDYGKVRANEEYYDVSIIVDSIQEALSCCGARDWTDYVNESVIGEEARYDFDGTELVIPNSCCRPWWLRDLSCSEYAHIWGNPGSSPEQQLLFESHINKVGCVDRLVEQCTELVDFVGPQLFAVSVAGGICTVVKFLCVLVQLRNILKIHAEGLKEKEQTAQAGGFFHFNDKLEVQESKYGHLDDNALNTLPPPTVVAATEHLKLRPPNEETIRGTIMKSDYNEFQARMQNTNIGYWLKEAQEIVLQGEEPEVSSAFLPRVSVREEGFVYVPNSEKRVKKVDKAIKGPRKSSLTYVLGAPHTRLRKRDLIEQKRRQKNPQASVIHQPGYIPGRKTPVADSRYKFDFEKHLAKKVHRKKRRRKRKRKYTVDVVEGLLVFYDQKKHKKKGKRKIRFSEIEGRTDTGLRSLHVPVQKKKRTRKRKIIPKPDWIPYW